MNMHQLVLLGRATRDTEELTSKDDKKYAKFSVAVNDFNGKTKEERTTFYDILVFGPSADSAVEKVKKGDAVMVMGKPEVEAFISKKDKEPKVSITVISESWRVLK
jgi:single-strand DNA-binding protein